MTTEIFKAIKDFPLYEVSNFGNVISWKPWNNTKVPRILKSGTDKDGYKQIVFVKGKKRYTKRVHHLVLNAFTRECPKGFQTCHNDGNPSNNHIENLRWDTVKNNNADKIKHGTAQRGEKNGFSKLKEKDVIDIFERASQGQPKKDIAKMYNSNLSNVYHICKGRVWKHLNLVSG